MHDVKNKVNEIKRENISLEIDVEFFMSQMIEEIKKKVYWKESESSVFQIGKVWNKKSHPTPTNILPEGIIVKDSQ